MRKPIIIIGAGGHSTVLLELLKTLDVPILGVVAPEKNAMLNYSEISYLGDDTIIPQQYDPNKVLLVNGVGGISVEKNHIREMIFLRFKSLGYQFGTLVHPFTFIASSVKLNEGVQIMAGVCIQPNTTIDVNTIINTGAKIDHDCIIGQHVHITPSVTLCGNIEIGNHVHIGVGANIIQGIKIGSDAMICAGATIVKNVLASQKISASLTI